MARSGLGALLLTTDAQPEKSWVRRCGWRSSTGATQRRLRRAACPLGTGPIVFRVPLHPPSTGFWCCSALPVRKGFFLLKWNFLSLRLYFHSVASGSFAGDHSDGSSSVYIWFMSIDKIPLRLLFLKPNSPSSFSLSSHGRCTHSLIILLALPWACSSLAPNLPRTGLSSTAPDPPAAASSVRVEGKGHVPPPSQHSPGRW